MSRINHKYNTRIKTGVIKRKKYYFDNHDSDNDNDDDSDNDDSYDSNYSDYSDYDDINYKLDEYYNYDNNDNNDNSDNSDDEFNKNKILAKDKHQYHLFLNKLFPSEYSKNKANSIKRQKLCKLNSIIDKNPKIINKKSKCIYKFDDDNLSSISDLSSNATNNKYNIILNMKNNKNFINCKNNLSDNDPNNNIEYEFIDNDNTDEYIDQDYEDKPKKGDKKTRNNYKKFNKIISYENEEDEYKYFSKNLTNDEQKLLIKKLKKIKKFTNIDKPYLIHLINLDIPDIYKAVALKKITMLRDMGSSFGNGEFYKIKTWVDTFIKIPFNKYNNLNISFADGVDNCHEFMLNAKNTLDDVVYGLEDAKIQIMQLIGLWLVNPNAVGSAISIKGPMGTGKTTLIKDGISKILNRPFELVALGGCGDSGFLDGHDYTYEGSKYGKIIDILIKSNCMNSVILFDELDKISDSPKGEEITGVLTHLTDTTQNTNFVDKYMSEISLDMSKALFIFSYNDESKVNNILKDRMYKIETIGYNVKDKLIICKNYLLPKIYDLLLFNHTDIIFDDNSIEYIINNFTDKEFGVRNLKRCLETICSKLNLYRLMKEDTNLFKNSINIDDNKKVSFPFTINISIINKLLKKSNNSEPPFGMYN